MLGASLPKVSPANVLIAVFPLRAGKGAAFVAQEFHLPLLPGREPVQAVKSPVQPEVRHHIAKLFPVQFRLKLLKLRQDLRRRGDQIEAGKVFLQIPQQQLRTHDHSVRDRSVSLKQLAQSVAFPVGEMFHAQQRIAEGEACGNRILPRQFRHVLRPVLSEADAAPAPEAVCRRAIEGTDLAPLVKILPVFPKQRQKHPVQLIELK